MSRRKFDFIQYQKLMFQRGLDPSNVNLLRLFQDQLDGHIPSRKDGRYGGEMAVIADRVKAEVIKAERTEEFKQQSAVSPIDRLSAALGNDPQSSLHPTQVREAQTPLERLTMYYQQKDDLAAGQPPFAYEQQSDASKNATVSENEAVVNRQPGAELTPLERLNQHFKQKGT